MARRSLKPQLNQIRTWVRQGRTDAWIAHQLEVSVREIDTFKREHELVPADSGDSETDNGPRLDEEPDLRAEDDALVAAALDAEPEEDEEDEAEDSDDDSPEGERDDGDGDGKPRKRRRGRRGGRGRRTGRGSRPLEGTFDHGDEGYGLWLDPAVQDNAVYAEHWAGHRPVTVTIEPDRIVLERAGDDADGSGGSDDSDADSDDDSGNGSSLDPDEFGNA
jgi:hypothetical protein